MKSKPVEDPRETPEAIALHERVLEALNFWVDSDPKGETAALAKALRLTLPSLSPALLKSVAQCLGVEGAKEEE